MTDNSYVYALIRPAPAMTLPDRGILNAPVRTVASRDHGLAALVSTVDASRFSVEGLQGGIADLAWLEPVARAHDAVVNAAAHQVATIPFRLGTTCADDAAVRDLLTDLGPAAARVLDRLDGRHEWTVHVFAPAVQTSPAARPTGETGAGFLARRRAELEGAAAGRDRDVAAGEQVFAAGTSVAVAARRLPVQDGRLRTDPRTMVLNAAFLVDDTMREPFLDSIARGGRGHRRGPGHRLGALGRVLLRRPPRLRLAGGCRGELVNAPTLEPDLRDRASLVDLLDRVLGAGVVLSGDLVISLAGVDLVVVRLRALLSTAGDGIGE